MAIIKGIHLFALRNSEFAQFTSDVLELIKRNDPVTLQVEEAYNALLVENEQLIDLMKPEKGSTLTEQVEAADQRRDLAVSGINQVVSGYTNHYDETTRTHALTLQRHLEQYGAIGLARENYQSETASIRSVVADWEAKAPLAEAITFLNLTGWKEELIQANAAFSDLYINRTEETGSASPETVRSKRLDMVPQYYELRDLIASYYTIQKGAEPYGSIVSKLNALIDKYQALLAARK